MLEFAGILLAMFAIGMMQIILATAMPFIVAEIGGGSLYAWVFSSYMLASLATIPLFSKLADIYGKRKFYLLGMGIFALGSLYGGLAPGMTHLITARVIQGLGAGIITPVALAMITDMFPPAKRGNMIGVFGFVQLVSNLISPPLGSFITKSMDWHWIFFLNLGMVVLSCLLMLVSGTRASESGQEMSFSMRPSEIDIAGGLIFGGFCGLTVYLFNMISKQNKWDVGGWLFLLAAVIMAIILVILEKRHQNPIIKIEFLKTKVLRRSIINAILAGAIMYGLVTILPLAGVILSKKQGFHLNESNLLLLFMVGITVGLLGSSRLAGKLLAGKLGSGYITKFLWGMMSISALFMIYFISIGNQMIFNGLNVVNGLCTGGIMGAFLINSQNSVNSEDRTTLSGLIQLGRYFGASIGVTILTGMLPEVGRISGIEQFVGAFGLLVALCGAGLVNEII
ncbi:MAG TPA: MFS transporter [Bacillota bacterium]|nr:MFS transporter [Bacillota bacterium]